MAAKSKKPLDNSSHSIIDEFDEYLNSIDCAEIVIDNYLLKRLLGIYQLLGGVLGPDRYRKNTKTASDDGSE